MKIDRIFSAHIKSLAPIPTEMYPGGSLTSPIKCILFDIYGTLFISGTGDIGIAQRNAAPITPLQSLLSKYQLPVPPDSLLKSFFQSIENEHHALRAQGVDFPEVDIQKIWSTVLQTSDVDMVKKFALEFELIKNPVYPMPHLSELLSACHTGEIVMGIVSNAQFYTPLLFQYFLKSDMASLGFSNDLIFMSYQSGYAKPSLHLFKKAAEKTFEKGIGLDEVLFLGNDMRNDIYPATEVGFRTGLFAGDSRSLRLREDDPLCANLKPDLVITGLEQLLQHLKLAVSEKG